MAASVSWCEGYGVVESAQCVPIAPFKTQKITSTAQSFTAESYAMSQDSRLLLFHYFCCCVLMLAVGESERVGVLVSVCCAADDGAEMSDSR